VLARFFCAVILHMMLQNELNCGLRNMKFALNHHYRFDNPWIAFLSGFLQASSIFVCEIVNVIVILTSTNYLDVVMNFLALAVISEFDDAFYQALGASEKKWIIEQNDEYEDLYKITRTSSHSARFNKKNLLVDDDTVPHFFDQQDANAPKRKEDQDAKTELEGGENEAKVDGPKDGAQNTPKDGDQEK
jgi:hypothetical protein